MCTELLGLFRLLGFHHADRDAVHEEDVVGRAYVGIVFTHRYTE